MSELQTEEMGFREQGRQNRVGECRIKRGIFGFLYEVWTGKPNWTKSKLFGLFQFLFCIILVGYSVYYLVLSFFYDSFIYLFMFWFRFRTEPTICRLLPTWTQTNLCLIHISQSVWNSWERFKVSYARYLKLLIIGHGLKTGERWEGTKFWKLK